MMERTPRVRRMAGVWLIGIASLLGCDSPLRPIRSQDTQTFEYSVSGIITYEDGRPASGASVGLASDPGAIWFYRATAGTDGTYLIRFSQPSLPPAVINAYVQDSWNIRPVDWAGQKTVVRNIRLHSPRTFNAGESMTITIEPDSPLCSWELGSSMTTLCVWFNVTQSTAGAVRVDARAIDSGGVPPLLGFDYLGSGATLTFQVSADMTTARVGFNLAIPVSAAPQRYEVTTTILGNR